MATFQQFLEALAVKEKQPERRQRREEWLAAVGRLYDQIRAWLAEADPQRFLDVIPFRVECVEPSLGVYDAPALKIGMGDAAVQIRPVGRDGVAQVEVRGEAPLQAAGRVDIRRKGGGEYILYRTLNDGQETWYVLDEWRRAAPFDRRRLEGILQDLLS